MTQWIQFPRSERPTQLVHDVIGVFSSSEKEIDSRSFNLNSDQVLRVLRPRLEELGFRVEAGKRSQDKVAVPVLYGMNGRVDKSFEADAYHPESGFVLEVEAGRAVDNNQFLKDLFQACMMDGVDFLGVAVRRDYRGANNFDHVCRYFETLYASDRIKLPLRAIVVIGY